MKLFENKLANRYYQEMLEGWEILREFLEETHCVQCALIGMALDYYT